MIVEGSPLRLLQRKEWQLLRIAPANSLAASEGSCGPRPTPMPASRAPYAAGRNMTGSSPSWTFITESALCTFLQDLVHDALDRRSRINYEA